MKKILLFNILIIAVIIFFLETLIRFFNIVELQGYDSKVYYLENEIILNKSNTTFKVSGKFAKTDKNGFRVPLGNFSYNNNKNNILILGDSVTFGVGVNEKESFVGILRKNFKRNLYNTSIVGHNLKSYLYIIDKNYNNPDVEFDDVLIFLCLNDIVPYQGVISKENSNFFDKYFRNNITLKINLFFREKSAIYVFLKSLLTSPVERHYQYMRAMYDDKKNLREFKNYIHDIKKYSKFQNLDTKFILLPYAYQIKNDCKNEFMKPQNEIKKIFNELNLRIYDFSYKFCENSDREKLFLPFDPVHLSKYGHKYFSNLLIDDRIVN